MTKASGAAARWRAVLLVSPLLLPLSLASCARKPKEIRVTPARTTLYGLKRTFVMGATVTDTKGKEIPGPALTWQTDRAKVATIDKNGVVTAVGPGRTAVIATYQNLTGKAALEVVDVASILVSPLRMTLAGPPGTKGTFRSEAKSSKGEVVSAQAKWVSSDTKVATVDAHGVVTSVAPGRSTITASLGDVANSADLQVVTRPVAQFDANPKTMILRVGDTQTITPTALDDSGKEIPDPAVDWVSSDPNTAKVADGRVTGVARGTATVRATSGTRTAEVSVLVN